MVRECRSHLHWEGQRSWILAQLFLPPNFPWPAVAWNQIALPSSWLAFFPYLVFIMPFPPTLPLLPHGPKFPVRLTISPFFVTIQVSPEIHFCFRHRDIFKFTYQNQSPDFISPAPNLLSGFPGLCGLLATLELGGYQNFEQDGYTLFCN